LAQQSVEGYALPDAGKLGAWTIANLGARYEVLQGLELSANVNNLFNTMPPVDHTQPGTSNQPFSIFNYNNYGRSYFLGLNYRFDSP
jgi:outer membrane receptor protein involved in Fe transport